MYCGKNFKVKLFMYRKHAHNTSVFAKAAVRFNSLQVNAAQYTRQTDVLIITTYFHDFYSKLPLNC